MFKKLTIKPVATILGIALMGSLAAGAVAAADNPFAATRNEGGFRQLAGNPEGKCSGAMDQTEGKCGVGKCGDAMGKTEGKCGDAMGRTEGKCSEGKCGEGKCGDAMGKTEGKCGSEKKD